MSNLILYGLPPSSYVRTASMALHAKGVDFELEFPDFRSGAYREIHPFGRIPALRHGDLVLYETLAITTYVDEAFDGPALQPDDPAQKARMLQWISAINDYVYTSLVIHCITERFVKPMRGEETNEALIEASKPDMQAHLALLDQALDQSPYLAGDTETLADFFLAPILFYFGYTPEGKEMLLSCAKLTAWQKRMTDVKGYAEVNVLPSPTAA